MRDTLPLTLTLDGQTSSLGLLQDIDNDKSDPLVRAVIISLFTWRRAHDDDVLPNAGMSRMGWWGDSFPPVAIPRPSPWIQGWMRPRSRWP